MCRLQSEQQRAASKGLSIGRIAGRATAVGFSLYVVSLIYRSGNPWMALLMAVFIVLYALASIARGLAYRYLPWEPVEWVPTSPEELDPRPRKRAIRWTVVHNLLLTIGSLGTLAVVYSAGLEQLGDLLLVGGIPAAIVQLYGYYATGTRPWYPSVPREPEIEP